MRQAKYVAERGLCVYYRDRVWGFAVVLPRVDLLRVDA